MTQRYTVVLGTPIDHSLSPVMHEAICQSVQPFSADSTLLHYNNQTDKPCEGSDLTASDSVVPYPHLSAVNPESVSGLRAYLKKARSDRSFVGAAITIPYKQDACVLVDEMSEHAKAIGAVNTIIAVKENTQVSGDNRFVDRSDSRPVKFQHSDSRDETPSPNTKLRGDNTDHLGFTAAFEIGLNRPIAYRRFILFGTGGVARSIAYALFQGQAAHVSVVGRSREKAQALIDSLGLGGSDTFEPYGAAPGKHYDCAINATSLGLRAFDELIVEPAWLKDYAESVFDSVYRPTGTTRLVKTARQLGLAAIDGKRMLAAQGAYQAQLWGSTLPLEEIIAIMSDAIGANEATEITSDE